jgi:hypothetical protein
MPAAAGRHADPFSVVAINLSTSFNRGMRLEAIAALLGHRKMQMTLIYANPRELHHPGEKPQVTRSALAPNRFMRPMAQAC